MGTNCCKRIMFMRHMILKIEFFIKYKFNKQIVKNYGKKD